MYLIFSITNTTSVAPLRWKFGSSNLSRGCLVRGPRVHSIECGITSYGFPLQVNFHTFVTQQSAWKNTSFMYFPLTLRYRHTAMQQSRHELFRDFDQPCDSKIDFS